MILLTGSTGYIGKEIIKHLKSDKIIGLSRRYKSDCYKHVNCCITELVHEHIKEDISTIIHSAAIIDNKSRDLFRINVEGTRKLIEFAKEKKVNHFIFISTTCVQLELKNKYALSKLEAEKLVVESGIPYTIIRPNIIFGENKKDFMLLLSLIKKFKIVPVPGDGNFNVAPVHESDLVNAIISCVNNEKSYWKTYCIGGQTMTYNEFLNNIALSLNSKCLLLHINKKLLRMMLYPYDKEFVYSFQNRDCNDDKAFHDLNFTPRPFMEGLRSISNQKRRVVER